MVKFLRLIARLLGLQKRNLFAEGYAFCMETYQIGGLEECELLNDLTYEIPATDLTDFDRGMRCAYRELNKVILSPSNFAISF